MTALQIYSGLAPVLLGMIALAMAQFDLFKIRRRKKTSRIIVDREFPGKQSNWLDSVIESPNSVVYVGIGILFVAMLTLAAQRLIDGPKEHIQIETKSKTDGFAERFTKTPPKTGIGGP